jgi:hypothetical protein
MLKLSKIILVVLLNTIALLIFQNKSYAQHKIILNSGREIDCEIIFTDKTSVYYSFISEDGRKLNSYAKYNEIESMQFEQKNIPHISDLNQNQIIDTTKFVKTSSDSDSDNYYYKKNKQISNKSQWINIISSSLIINANSQGFSVQYYGFNILEDSPISFPISILFERLAIDSKVLHNSDVRYLEQSYFKVGLTPFNRLTDKLFSIYGANLILGTEYYSKFYGGSNEQFLFGVEPKLGLYFIPNIDLGIVFGISGTLKVQNSSTYNSDLGVQFEFGFNF